MKPNFREWPQRLLFPLLTLALVTSFAVGARVFDYPSTGTNTVAAQPADNAPATLDNESSAPVEVDVTEINAETVANVVSLTTATGLCTITRGAGQYINGDWIGAYMCNGKALQCPDPMKPTAQPKSVGETASVYYPNSTTLLPGANVAKLNYVLTTFGANLNDGGTKRYDNDYASATRFATWAYSGQSARLNRDLPYANANVKKLYTAMVNAANAYAGPYVVTQTAKADPTLGKAGYYKYRVTSKTTGKGIPGIVFAASLKTANAKLTAASYKTDANGYFTVGFTRTKWGSITVGLVSGLVVSPKVTQWNPIYSSYQRFHSAAVKVKLSLAFTSNVGPASKALGYNCTENCFAEAPVTMASNYCNTYGGTARLVPIDNGVARLDYLELAVGQCDNKVWMVKDDHTFQLRLDVLVGTTWISTMLPNKIVVDCPPWPSITVETYKDCVKGYIKLTATANSAHKVSVVVNGERFPSTAAGVPVTHQVNFSCSVPNTFTVKAGTQRDNGAWNDSPADVYSFGAVKL